MSVQRQPDGFPGVGVPDSQCLVPAGGNKLVAIRTERHGVDPIGMTNERGTKRNPPDGILQSKSRRAEMNQAPVTERLLVTRYDPARVETGQMLSVNDIVELLAIPLLGVIPESQIVLESSNQGRPVVLENESAAGQAYDDAVARLLGEKRPMRFLTAEKKGFFKRLFGK